MADQELAVNLPNLEHKITMSLHPTHSWGGGGVGGVGNFPPDNGHYSQHLLPIPRTIAPNKTLNSCHTISTAITFSFMEPIANSNLMRCASDLINHEALEEKISKKSD